MFMLCCLVAVTWGGEKPTAGECRRSSSPRLLASLKALTVGWAGAIWQSCQQVMEQQGEAGGTAGERPGKGKARAMSIYVTEERKMVQVDRNVQRCDARASVESWALQGSSLTR